MTSKRYSEEFKIEAVKQVTDRGYSVIEVAERLGMTTHSLYAWMKRYGEPNPRQANKADDQAEIAVKRTSEAVWVCHRRAHKTAYCVNTPLSTTLGNLKLHGKLHRPISAKFRFLDVPITHQL